ncbi:MAG: S9 family peptidase [Xanthomonadales bacterium]|nr:S9 family peptidase [Xanthomonadales bacterium]
MPFRFILACMLGALLAAPAAARVSVVKPGKQPTLAADEGLLLVAVDSSVDLNSVRVKKEGKLFSSGVLSNIKSGQSVRLYVVPAGAYAWEQLRAFGRVRYDFKDDPEYRFEVRPGTITYGGDLVFRPTSYLHADVQVTNRGLRALDWLDREHPGLAARFPFTYSGHYPDPFPAFYATQRARKAPSGEDGRAPPAAGALPLPIRDLWREERIGRIALNPGGDLLAEHVRDGDDWSVDLIDLAGGTSRRLASTPLPYVSLQWVGDRTVLLGVGDDRTEQAITVFQVGEAAGGQHRFEVLKFPHPGRILQELADETGQVLFASYGGRGKLLVHKVDLSSQRALEKSASLANRPLNRGIDDDMEWFADGRGRLRAVVVRRDDRLALLHGIDGNFSEVLDLHATGGFDPYVLSWDGDLMYGLTDEDRTQRDLVVFDPATGQVAKTLFSKPGVDVVSPLMNERRTPIGVTYFSGGHLISEYFGHRDQQLSEVLEKTFPNRTVLIKERSRDGRQLVVAVEGSAEPARLYHLDVAARRASLLEDARPWLEGKPLVASQRFAVRNGDGLPIEAYLTLPPGSGKRALVVMPHGGPVGVNDRLDFDPQVQFIASLGYAVLQVNFRGSDGYGKAFREAGHHAHGTGIEDDIAAALDQALASYPLDPARVCMLGSSYGGYSAMVSTLRWPGRFRCAVSIAGVSDRMLFFTASDGGHSARGREQLERIIGNPRAQQAEMMATSPLYHYRELTTPLMLVHGEEDMRVDFEHSRRLARMLQLAGRPPVLLALAGEGHGIAAIDNIEATWSGIAGFLRHHLDAASAGTPP